MTLSRPPFQQVEQGVATGSSIFAVSYPQTHIYSLIPTPMPIYLHMAIWAHGWGAGHLQPHLHHSSAQSDSLYLQD